MRCSTRVRSAHRRTAPGFLQEESGTVTVFAVLGFAMCMVLVGLVFDVGRVMGIHTQVNSYADGVALAAAEELDGRPGAMARAMTAANPASSAIGAGQRLSLSGDSTILVDKLTFFSRLDPRVYDPNKRSPFPDDEITATWTVGQPNPVIVGNRTRAEADADSRYVLIDTTRETENYLLLPVMAWMTPGIDRSITVAPQAVAGFSRSLCNSAPLMLCNPKEANAVNARFTFDRNNQIKGRIRTDGGPLRPGDLKVLRTPNGTSAQQLRQYMGRIEPNTFCTANDVDIRANTSLAAIRDGLNTRFDIFSASIVGSRNDSDYTPAPPAPKGFQTNASNCVMTKSPATAPPQPTTTTPLPRDDCFMLPGAWPAGSANSGTGCSSYLGTPLAGDGVWNRNDYWNTNHPGVTPPTDLFSMNRYDVYRAEIAANVPTTEQRCSTNPNNRTTNPLRDRRVIPVAVVNCLNTQTAGDRDDVPVEAYAEIFLTEPLYDGDPNRSWWGATATDVYFEILGYSRSNLPATVQREYPVLFR